MTELRELRRAANLSQHELAVLMCVPVNTFRMWDSGLRPVPLDVVQRAKLAVTEHANNTQLVSLGQLARELGDPIGRGSVQGPLLQAVVLSDGTKATTPCLRTRPLGLCPDATTRPTRTPADANAARQNDRRG
jgi:hypothetical protein